jgi:hypothetical protein
VKNAMPPILNDMKAMYFLTEQEDSEAGNDCIFAIIRRMVDLHNQYALDIQCPNLQETLIDSTQITATSILMGDIVPLTRDQEDWTFFSDLIESYWSGSNQSFDLANLKPEIQGMFLHRCPRITRIESIRTPFRFRVEASNRLTRVHNARGDDFERIYTSIKATLSRYGVGSVNEDLKPSLSINFHASSFDKLYALLLGMKTIVDMISQDVATTMISTNMAVGPMVFGADPNASTKDVFSALTRSEKDFVMSLQADDILTLAEYALRALVDERRPWERK